MGSKNLINQFIRIGKRNLKKCIKFKYIMMLFTLKSALTHLSLFLIHSQNKITKNVFIFFFITINVFSNAAQMFSFSIQKQEGSHS